MGEDRPQDEVPASPIFVVGIVSSLLVFASVVGLAALFISVQKADAESKREPSRSRIVEESQQHANLAEYRILDPEKKIVRIPIERAMDLVVEDLRKEGDKR